MCFHFWSEIIGIIISDQKEDRYCKYHLHKSVDEILFKVI